MGQIEAGRWAVILSIYFFVLFLSIYSTLNASDEYEDMTVTGLSVNELAFSTVGSPYVSDMVCRSGSLPGLTAFCSQTLAYSESSCEIIPGCTWYDSSDECKGLINLISYGGQCSEQMDLSLCLVLGCAVDADSGDPIVRIDNETGYGYTTYIDASEGGYNGIVDTLTVMMGIDARLGLSQPYAFVASFFYAWIPAMMLIVSIYMLLPFAH